MLETLKGKKGLIMGVANDHSLAWGIADALSTCGADLCFTFQNEILKKRVVPLAEKAGSNFLVQCDVKQEGNIKDLFETIKNKWGNLDFVVHAVAFSDKEQLRGQFVETTRDNFINTLDISCYSFIETSKYAASLMNQGGSLLTLSYYGSVKVIPHYNVMGVAKAALEATVRYLAEDLGKRNIRVNALSAGPIKTLASSGIGDFNYILKWNQYNAPLRRSVTLGDVGRSACFLVSELSSGVTGTTLYVDCGYHAIGLKATDAPDISLVTNL